MTAKDRTKDFEALVKEVTRTLFKRGEVIKGGWQALAKISFDGETPDCQKQDMRMAYYAGAQHVFASLAAIIGGEAEPTEEEFEAFNSIAVELDNWHKEMMAGLQDC